MTAPRQAEMANKLLAMLPSDDYVAIASHAHHCGLPQGTVLAKVGQPIEYVHFLTKGVGSVVVVSRENNRAEAGLFGFEGYVPAHAAAGAQISPHEVVIQIAAEAYRINFDDFVRLIDSNKNFRVLVHRAVAAFGVQLSYTGASNSIHEVAERLARWLLMCHDRVDGNEINLTHDFMALMLAVRRPSVTTALHVLEGNRFIRAQRGLVTIRDRAGMEEFAYDAYGRPEEEYDRLMKDLF